MLGAGELEKKLQLLPLLQPVAPRSVFIFELVNKAGKVFMISGLTLVLRAKIPVEAKPF